MKRRGGSPMTRVDTDIHFSGLTLNFVKVEHFRSDRRIDTKTRILHTAAHLTGSNRSFLPCSPVGILSFYPCSTLDSHGYCGGR